MADTTKGAVETFGYLITWDREDSIGRKTCVSKDPCHEDDGTSEPLVRHSDYLALAAENAALVADAERYRWLRDFAGNQLYLTRNADHACNYVTAKDWIENCAPECYVDCDEVELQRMKDADTIWTVQVYPNTPIGFNWYHAATLDAAIDAALTRATEDEKDG